MKLNMIVFTDIDDCSPDPCSYGTCLDGVDGYRCVCLVGYTGTRCDISKLYIAIKSQTFSLWISC